MPREKRRRSGISRRHGRIITVGVIARHVWVREALTLALSRSHDIELLDCGTGSVESVMRVRDLALRIILIALPTGPAASFAASLRTAAPEVRPVVILDSQTDEDIARLVRAGVVGFIPAGANLAESGQALRKVHIEGHAWPRGMKTRILQARKGCGAPAGQAEMGTVTGLRGRQLEIATCLAEGLTNKEISVRLQIAEGTVKSHVHAVLRALGVKRRWEIRPLGPVAPSTRD